MHAEHTLEWLAAECRQLFAELAADGAELGPEEHGLRELLAQFLVLLERQGRPDREMTDALRGYCYTSLNWFSPFYSRVERIVQCAKRNLDN